MLKRLRIQFVATIMVIVTLMLCLIFGLVYFFTRSNLEQESLSMMRSIAAISQQLGPPIFQFGRPDEEREQVRLPFFTIESSADGQLTATGGGYYDLTDSAFLREVFSKAIQANRPTGTLKSLHLRFLRADTPFGQRVIFADTTSERSTLYNLAKTCGIIGAVCLLLFLWISIRLAEWVVKPVEKAWRQQRQFISDASHELKTPLTVIIANAELLEGETSGEVAFVRNILSMSRQMRCLVERLLELARADSEQRTAELVPVDFSTLVSDALLPFEPAFFEAGLQLSSVIAENLSVCGEEQQLRHLIDILLDNAQKYALPGGQVSVRLSSWGHHRCRLTVANPCSGLTAEELQNLFKRFYRTDPARLRNGSFGLGLSIAESIVLAHHGHIWAESGHGAICFTVELPIAK